VLSLERRKPAPGAPNKESNLTFRVGVEILAGAGPVTASDVSTPKKYASIWKLHRSLGMRVIFCAASSHDM